jgi:hypothetical protein
LKIVDLPDGFTGGGRENSFTIGETFNAYLQQASRIAFQKNAGVIPVPVQVTIVDAKLTFTNDAMAAWDLVFVIDWAHLTLKTINLTDNQTKEIQTESEVRYSSEETAGVASKGRAVAIEEVLADSVADYLHQISASNCRR